MKSPRTLLSLIARAVAAAGSRLDLLGEAGRRLISVLAFAVVASGVYYAVPSGERVNLGLTAGWNAASAAYLLLTWIVLLGGTSERARRWAIAQDAPRSRVLQRVFGRAVGLGIVLLATVAGLLTAAGLLPQDGDQASQTLGFLSGLAVIEAWLVLQTAYGLYYAYLYYVSPSSGGLQFPGEQEPNLTDFAYFAFAVGTAFAVSDVRVTSSRVRRVVLGHSLISFAYNAAILTLALGVVFNVVRGP